MQQRSEMTRQLFKDTATALFAERGYTRTSVNHICAACGMSKGAFYHHFSSKSELFNQLLNDWLSEVDAEIATGVEGSGQAGLNRLALAYGKLLANSRAQLPLLLEFWQAASKDEDVRRSAALPYRHYAKMVEQMLAQQGQTVISAGERSMAARVLLAMGVGGLIMDMLEGSKSRRIEPALMIDIFLNGISGRRA